MSPRGNTLLGLVTVGALLFGSISFFLDGRSRSGGNGTLIAGLLLAFALVRAYLLYTEHQRRRRRGSDR